MCGGSRRVVASVHSIQLFSRASKANPKTRPVYYPSSSNHSAPDLSEAVVTKVFTEALRQPTVPTTTTSNQHSSAAKAHYPYFSTSDKIGVNQIGSRTENKLWLHWGLCWGVFVVNTHPRGGGLSETLAFCSNNDEN